MKHVVDTRAFGEVQTVGDVAHALHDLEWPSEPGA